MSKADIIKTEIVKTEVLKTDILNYLSVHCLTPGSPKGGATVEKMFFFLKNGDTNSLETLQTVEK